MPSWSGFARDAPDFAAAAERLLRGDDGLPIAFLATATRGGVPHLGPVCPILRFSIEHALWVFWERAGQPDTKAVRRRWSAGDRR